MTPTQRALRDLRGQGYLAAVVERWIPGARIRRDLFGIADIVALTQQETLFVQACAGSSHAARRRKILASRDLWRVQGPNRHVEIWSYSKTSPRGTKLVRWTLRRERITGGRP